MSLTREIVATYRGPSRVHARLMSEGRNEMRALVFVMIAGALIFVASAPYHARAAQLDPRGPLAVRLYWSGFLWVFIMPLLMYGFAGVLWILSRLAGRRTTGFEIRMTLFWSLLASTPVLLLLGLVAGLIGPGVQVQSVAIVWICVFLWFCLSGLSTTAKELT